jgi:hypothetical protein
MILKREDNLHIPVALFGVSALIGDDTVGVPWMVATDNLREVRHTLMRNTKKYMDIMLNLFNFLINFVDTRNTESIKWLKRCGFTFGEIIYFGKDNVPFQKFYIKGAV